MISSFKEMGLSEPLLRALKDMEFEEPTEVQTRAIPHVLNGEDVIVMSKTGSGKTAVFGTSVLQLTDPSDPGPQCLILEPTRELAVQVDHDLKKMAKYVPHSSAAIYGQHNINIEKQSLSQNVTFVTGTPGRVYDHIQQKTFITKNIKFLVLDEVDRMMDMGFIDQVRRILRTLPKNRITMLFSATIPPEIAQLCSQFMKAPVTIKIESKTLTVNTIEQKYYRVERNEKRTQLNRILLMERPRNCMIFCNTKKAVDQVQSFLNRKGYAARSLHGDIPQNRRMKNIEQFKKGSYNILVATDVAARGIHVEDLSLVINYDVPLEPDSYIHRIGRTGRAGHDGQAVSLVTGEDIMTLYAIEEHIGTMISQEELPTDKELSDQKEQSDAWIKANAYRDQPSRQASARNIQSQNKSRQNKSNQKKTYQKGEAKRQNPNQRQEQIQGYGRQAVKGQSNTAVQSQQKNTDYQARRSSSRQVQKNIDNQRTKSAEHKASAYSRDNEQSLVQHKLQENEQHRDMHTLQSKQKSKVVNAESASQHQEQIPESSGKKSFLKRILEKIIR